VCSSDLVNLVTLSFAEAPHLLWEPDVAKSL
jgi:hypothetical protein